MWGTVSDWGGIVTHHGVGHLPKRLARLDRVRQMPRVFNHKAERLDQTRHRIIVEETYLGRLEAEINRQTAA